MKALGSLFRVSIVFYVLGLAVYVALRLIFGGELWWLALLNNFAPYFFLPLLALALLALVTRLNPRFVLLPLLLLVVGLVWYGPLFAPRPQAAPAADSVKVVSFNVWANNRQLDTTETWLRAQNADIVLLQEAYHDLPARLADVYPYTLPDPPQPQDRQILSRHPILERSTHNGYERAVVDFDGTAVAVYDVHFGVPFVNEPHLGLHSLPYPLSMVVRYNEENRNAQIRNWLAALENEPMPVIVGGDFNTSDNSAMYPIIAAALTDSYREVETGFGTTWPVTAKLPLALDALPPLMRIDYVWHSDTLRALDVEVGPEIGSDHRPVVAVLALPEATS